MTAVFPRPPDRDDASGDLAAFVPLARLASLSETLATQPLGPSPAFRQELRARLLAEAATGLAGRATGGPDDGGVPGAPGTAGLASVRTLRQPHRHPVVRGAAAGIALVLAGGGVAAAAASASLPGDALHPVKRFTESVRTAADPHRDRPSHVLRQIDTRISELRRSTRPVLGATPQGVALDRWPAMLSTLGDVEADLNRLAPQAAEPAVRASLLDRRQRLADILPMLTAQQQPAVQRLLTEIDTLTGSAGAGGLLSLPGSGLPGPGLPAGLAVAGGIGDVLMALRTDAGPSAGATSAHRSPSSSHRTRSASSTASYAPAATVSPSTSTRSQARRATAAARTAPVRTVRVTVTTVTTRSADGVATTVVGPATRTVTTAPGGAGRSASRTVSTTTRTVVTNVSGSTPPTAQLPSTRSGSTSPPTTSLPTTAPPSTPLASLTSTSLPRTPGSS